MVGLPFGSNFGPIATAILQDPEMVAEMAAQAGLQPPQPGDQLPPLGGLPPGLSPPAGSKPLSVEIPPQIQALQESRQPPTPPAPGQDQMARLLFLQALGGLQQPAQPNIPVPPAVAPSGGGAFQPNPAALLQAVFGAQAQQQQAVPSLGALIGGA